MAHPDNTFIAKLLTPVAGLFDPGMFTGCDLSAEAEAIAEALEKVATLTATRDACGWGTRARAVQNIMLEWWAGKLADLIGFQTGRA